MLVCENQHWMSLLSHHNAHSRQHLKKKVFKRFCVYMPVVYVYQWGRLLTASCIVYSDILSVKRCHPSNHAYKVWKIQVDLRFYLKLRPID